MTYKIIPVSVIIPSYNSALYLCDCIESINNGCTPSEIIIIDDCSTDNSYEIAQKLADENKNIKVLKSIINSGAAAARKVGFLSASEEIVAWVDSDDLLEKDAIADAYYHLINDEFHADLCLWEVWRLSVDGSSYKHACNPEILPISGEEAVLLTLDGWKIHAAGLARKSLYLQAYDELEVDSFNNDEVLSRLLLGKTRKIISSTKKYYYRENPDSTTSKFNDLHLTQMRSNLWLIKFSLNLKRAPFEKVLYSSIGTAWSLYVNRLAFTRSVFIKEISIFVVGTLKIKKIWWKLLLSPKHFFGFLWLILIVQLYKLRSRWF